jgi:hypothetical protein
VRLYWTTLLLLRVAIRESAPLSGQQRRAAQLTAALMAAPAMVPRAAQHMILSPAAAMSLAAGPRPCVPSADPLVFSSPPFRHLFSTAPFHNSFSQPFAFSSQPLIVSPQPLIVLSSQPCNVSSRRLSSFLLHILLKLSSDASRWKCTGPARGRR